MNMSYLSLFIVGAVLMTQLSYADPDDKEQKKGLKEARDERKEARESRRDSRRDHQEGERKDSRENQERPNQQVPQPQPQPQQKWQRSDQQRKNEESREWDQRKPPEQRYREESFREKRDQSQPQQNRQLPDQRRPDVGSRESRDSQNERNDRNSMKNYERRFGQERTGPELNREEVKKRTEHLRSDFQKNQERGKKASESAEVRLKRHHPGYRTWFNGIFFQRHQYYPKYWRGNLDWWRGAQWNQIHYWLGWGNAVNPIYYDIGGYPIPIDPNWPGYATGFNSTDFSQLRGEEWLPLGVFALGRNEEKAVDSDVFLQLAIDRAGNLSGTYYNALTDRNYLLQGIVDPTTQQAYWRISQENFVLEMETGLYNLTQDFAYVQLTFLGGIVQNWVLIRVID